MEEDTKQPDYPVGEPCYQVAPYDNSKELRMQCVQIAGANKPHQDSYSLLSDAKAIYKFVNEGL